MPPRVSPPLTLLATTTAVAVAHTLIGALAALAGAAAAGPPLIGALAGLSAASILAAGEDTALAGVWAGSLAALALPLDTADVGRLATAGIMACALVAQAAVAGRILRAWRGGRPEAAAPGARLLAALAAALAAASITAALHLASLLASGSPDLVQALWTWAAALAGVLALTAPLALRPRLPRGLRGERSAVWLALQVGLILTAAVSALLWAVEEAEVDEAIGHSATSAATLIDDALMDGEHELELLSARSVVLGGMLSDAEFAEMARATLTSPGRPPGLRALSWAPLVSGGQRAPLEAAARRDGSPGFAIRQLDPAGRLVEASPRDQYVVARYSQLDSGASPATGLDYLADPAARQAIERAGETGASAATGPLTLPGTGTRGFLIFHPVYRTEQAGRSPAERRAALLGFVVGEVDGAALLDAILHDGAYRGLDVTLADAGAQAGALANKPPAGAAAVSDLLARDRAAALVERAGRVWRLSVTPTAAFQQERRLLPPALAAAFGLLITAGICRTLGRSERAAADLQLSEVRFRALIEKSANAVALLDRTGRIVYNSPNYQRTIGHAPGSRVGARAFERVHPDDTAAVAALFAELSATPRAEVRRQLRALHGDGSWRWLDVTATNMLDEPSVGAIVVNMHDVTDVMLAEAATRASAARLQTIIATALDGFWIVDQQQRFVDVNGSYCAMSGYSREELLRMRIGDVDAVERPEETEARVASIAASGSARFETRHRRKDGTLFDVEVAVHLIDGGLLVCFCRDITERSRRDADVRRLNSELERRVAERTADLSQVNAELARALRAKDEFLATMSHELRTPLNAILTFSELLTEQLSAPELERPLRWARQIDTSGQHLLTLINDILDLSKIEAGRMDLNVEALSIADLCEASVRFVRETALRKGLTVSFESNDTLAVMLIDGRRLKQMLVNLLSNAVKFTPAGGQVRLQVAADPERQQVAFSVQDTGIGIAPEDTGRLFTPFTQLDSSLTREHEGTGLGLALVRRLADLHGGSVTVESAGRGRGSRFTITLPWAAAPPPEPPPADPQPEPAPPPEPRRGARVLLAEDSEATIVAVSDYLAGRRYEVVVARNGREAVERASEETPAVILMDVQMPVMDGLAAMRELRQRPETRATPIVALTALAMPGDRERCLAAGADEYLTKPVSLRQLAELIGRMVEPAGARPEH